MEIVEALLKARKLARQQDLKPAASYLIDFLDRHCDDYAVLQHMVRKRLDPEDPDNLHDVLELAWAAYGVSDTSKFLDDSDHEEAGDEFTYVIAGDAEARSRRVDYDEFIFSPVQDSSGEIEVPERESDSPLSVNDSETAARTADEYPEVTTPEFERGDDGPDQVEQPVELPTNNEFEDDTSESVAELPESPKAPIDEESDDPDLASSVFEQEPVQEGLFEKDVEGQAEASSPSVTAGDQEDEEIADWLGIIEGARLDELIAEGDREEDEAHTEIVESADTSLPLGEEEDGAGEDDDTCEANGLGDYCGSGWQSTTTDFDATWEELALDADDFEESPVRDEFSETVDTDTHITRAQRALQVAIGVGDRFDLEKREIFQLAEIFEVSGWSATKTSVIDALSSNVAFDELWLAWQIKNIWIEHPEYSISAETLLKYPYVADRQTAGKYLVISWPGAIRILRAFPGVNDVEEIEVFLEQCFERWYWHPELWRSYRSFLSYVDYRTGRPAGSLNIWPGYLFDDYAEDAEWGWINGGTGATTPEYQFLERMNFLPQAKYYPSSNSYYGKSGTGPLQPGEPRKEIMDEPEHEAPNTKQPERPTGTVVSDDSKVVVIGNRIVSRIHGEQH